VEGPGLAVSPALRPVLTRKAAEYVLSLGGVVWVNGEHRDIRTSADLPRQPFTLTDIDLQDPVRAGWWRFTLRTSITEHVDVCAATGAFSYGRYY
jgi:hypothetical protein